jgi:hypothetical protein
MYKVKVNFVQLGTLSLPKIILNAYYNSILSLCINGT